MSNRIDRRNHSFRRRHYKNNNDTRTTESISETPVHRTKMSPPPSYLKGKALGLYYRDRMRLHTQKQEENGFINLNAKIRVPPGILELVDSYINKFEFGNDENISDEFEVHFNALLRLDFAKFLKMNDKKCHDERDETNARENIRQKYMCDLLEKQNKQQYKHMYLEREKLPTMQQQEHILNHIRNNQVILIVGSTGCGKTTQVPQILLDYYILNSNQAEAGCCRIVCSQPRRIAAISVAERVAHERAESLGNSVGYQIRLESCLPRDEYSILYCTTGIILQRMHTNPLLFGVDILILDEIHERNVETDLLMGLLKKVLPYRPEFKIILMSATVNEELFCKYFDNCPTVYIEGILHPIEVLYLEDILHETNYLVKSKYSGSSNQYYGHEAKSLQCSVAEGCEDMQFLEYLIFYICNNKPPGAILVFLPGFDKISKLRNLLLNPTSKRHKILLKDLLIYPLHSLMPTVNQRSVFETAPIGKRKIILSTTIAETSVTIDDVVYVVNCGRGKISDYDQERNIQVLQEDWVSKANNLQRKGRAGRCQPGICYNLYTRYRESVMIDVPIPEILCKKLEDVILKLKLLRIKDPLEFLSTLITPPKGKTVSNGIQLLQRIGALDDDNGEITPLGVHLAKLPIDPQIGKMILMSSLFRCMDPITSVAAGISHKTPFMTPLNLEKKVDQVKRRISNNSKSDHLLIHYVMQMFRDALANSNKGNCSVKEIAYENFLSLATLHQLKNMKQQFAEILYGSKFTESSDCLAKSSNINSGNIQLLRAIIASGLYPNIAFLQKSKVRRNYCQAIHKISTPEEKHINFHPSSVNCGEPSFHSNYFVYFQKQKSSSLYMLDATMVYPMALLIFGDGVTTGFTNDNRTPFITLARKYYFACDTKTSEVIIKLRNKLKLLLQKKILHPSPIIPESNDDYLIKAIQVLLSLDDIDD